MKTMPTVVLTSSSDLDLGPLVQRIVDKILALQGLDIKAAGFIKLQKPGKKGKSEIFIHNLTGEDTQVGVQGKGRGRRIGKFIIDTDALETALIGAIGFKQGVDMYVIHEIGPLETMSKNFSTAAKMLLKKDDLAVVATVSKQGRGFVREAKRLPGINAVEVSEENEETVEEQILKDLLTAFAARAKEREREAEEKEKIAEAE